MEKKPESNARVRQFFGFDPIEFVDDVVCATSFYINGLQESLSSLLSTESLSQTRQNEIKSKLFSALQSSIDLNSDIFELYLMRNIFHIPVDADLTSEIINKSNKSIINNSGSSFFTEVQEEEDLDSELTKLYQRIHEEQKKRIILNENIQTKRNQVYQTNEIVKRLPMIDNIVKNAKELPISEIEELHQRLNNIYTQFKSKQNDKNDKQTLAFHQAAFSFD